MDRRSKSAKGSAGREEWRRVMLKIVKEEGYASRIMIRTA